MDSKKRFSNRVENYIKYRPSYPKEAINFLYVNLGFNEKSIIADIGSGTGIFTKLLLERGSKVVAIEPNKEMRNAAEVISMG
jgi:16S rRNA A1518/A1519 N6-dimethyltransferase RsmA/KsgA/DIM1 with predicted DNA glycosylase/AP lyase activity